MMLDSAIGFLGNAYPWVKAAHVTFVIFWIAGLFLLPRFYVYHHATAPGSAEDRAWVERERRTRSIILGPALVIVWVLGLALAVHLGAFTQGLVPRQAAVRDPADAASRAGSAPTAASSPAATVRSRTRRCGS